MKDESITVVTVGKPDISAMSNGEKDEEQGTELSVRRG